MSRPFQHPKTGVYWLRKRVPADLVSRAGKKEERFSLRTRDPSEAKRLHAEALTTLDQRWATLRGEASSQRPRFKPVAPSTLTEIEAHQRAAWLYRYWLQKYRDNPSEQRFWRTDLFELLWRVENTGSRVPATLVSRS